MQAGTNTEKSDMDIGLYYSEKEPFSVDDIKKTAAEIMKVKVYPAELKNRIVQDYLWSAEFTLKHAAGYAASGDICNTVGCLTRITSYIVQVLFALNETYFIGDKRLKDNLSRFKIIPSGFFDKLSGVLTAPGITSGELEKNDFFRNCPVYRFNAMGKPCIIM